MKGLNQTKGVADVWWMCGPNRHLTPVLRGNWQGTCALASLIIPLTIIEVTANQLLGSTRKAPNDVHPYSRYKRDTPWSEETDNIHFNLLGVPVGVSSEF